ncbi:MAG: hypothetical protein ACREAA_15895 [Candidatus Polarisedimenticolia bacterium]
MSNEPVITIRLGRRALLAVAAVAAIAITFIILPEVFHAQKTQDDFKEKMDIVDPGGSVTVATSADGKYVYVAGPDGVIVSEEFGKTGTWVQTVRLK